MDSRLWHQKDQNRERRSFMITVRDIIYINRRRNGKKKVLGKKKYMFNFFAILFIVVILTNVIYGIYNKINNFFIDKEYPHKSILFVHNYEKAYERGYHFDWYNTPPISEEQLNALKNMKGVADIQSDFGNVRAYTYFDMNRVNYILPPYYLFKYDKEFFKLYVELPPEKIQRGTIPILMSRDLFNYRYVKDKNIFQRDINYKASWLGKAFDVFIDPNCRQPLPSWSWSDKDVREILLNPETMKKKIIDSQKKTLIDLALDNPANVRYCTPISIRVQVVGFIRDKSISPLVYGVIPREQANAIDEILRMRSNAFNDEVTRSRNNKLIYVLPEPEQRDSVIKKIKEMKLTVDTSETLQADTFLMRSIDDVGTPIFVAILFILVFFSFTIYQLLSAKVKDSIREIGTMRCVGATKNDVKRIFTYLIYYDMLKTYIIVLIISQIALLIAGSFTARHLNHINVDFLSNELFLIASRSGDFAIWWLIAPLWYQFLPLIFLIPVTAIAVYIPVLKASRTDPAVVIKE
ncbi:MAG: ABC transporter permease [Nitrospirae bacterium]|nr:ABC transporter permease [Nitrospirota bacterium]